MTNLNQVIVDGFLAAYNGNCKSDVPFQYEIDSKESRAWLLGLKVFTLIHQNHAHIKLITREDEQ